MQRRKSDNMFAIGIPTLNRYDLLQDALAKYQIDFPGIEIHIVDNGHQAIKPPEKGSVHIMHENIGVAASWNLLLDIIFKKHKVAFILNDDIYWGAHRGQAMEFIERVHVKCNAGFAACPQTWCAFSMTKKTFNQVGRFDENFFPAYWEDNDYSYRMELSKIKTCLSAELNPVIYRNSMTLHLDKSINDNFMKNKAYYEAKWGGQLGSETFKTPFGK